MSLSLVKVDYLSFKIKNIHFGIINPEVFIFQILKIGPAHDSQNRPNSPEFIGGNCFCGLIY